MACEIEPWAKDGLVGGCCASPRALIGHIAEHAEKHPHRKAPGFAPRMRSRAVHDEVVVSHDTRQITFLFTALLIELAGTSTEDR